MVQLRTSTSDTVSTAKTPLSATSRRARPAPASACTDCARMASSAATSDGLVNGWGRRTIQRSRASSPAAKAPKKAAPMRQLRPVGVRGGRRVGHEPGDDDADHDGDAERPLGEQQAARQVVVELARDEAGGAAARDRAAGQRHLGAPGRRGGSRCKPRSGPAYGAPEPSLWKPRITSSPCRSSSTSVGSSDGRRGRRARQHARPAQVAGDYGPVLRRELEAARLGPMDDLFFRHDAGIVAIPRYIATMAPGALLLEAVARGRLRGRRRPSAPSAACPRSPS